MTLVIFMCSLILLAENLRRTVALGRALKSLPANQLPLVDGYRSNSSPSSTREADDEPAFYSGDMVEVRHNCGPWFAARFINFSRTTSGDIYVKLRSDADSEETYALASIEMRHERGKGDTERAVEMRQVQPNFLPTR